MGRIIGCFRPREQIRPKACPHKTLGEGQVIQNDLRGTCWGVPTWRHRGRQGAGKKTRHPCPRAPESSHMAVPADDSQKTG